MQEALAANAWRNIENNKKKYHCETCKKYFPTKPSLRQHLTTKTHLILAADSGISLNTHISGISTNREIEDSKRKVRPISNHDLNAISKDKNIQTQIIHDSMNPPHHHIEIIATKDMLPKSPAPVLQDRNLYKETLEISNTFTMGKMLSAGVSVVITGPPNVGKSSLLNYLCEEEKAIVGSTPGTTRDVVSGELILDGVPFRFYATAGIRSARGAIEKEGVFRAIEKKKSRCYSRERTLQSLSPKLSSCFM
mgnify:CR=1 FL=1